MLLLTAFHTFNHPNFIFQIVRGEEVRSMGVVIFRTCNPFCIWTRQEGKSIKKNAATKFCFTKQQWNTLKVCKRRPDPEGCFTKGVRNCLVQCHQHSQYAG